MLQSPYKLFEQIKHGGYAGELKLYGTAQRQFDTRMHAAAWKFLGEDYAMRSIFERETVMFVPVSGKLSGMCTCKCFTHFWINLLMKLNINCIYTMNLQILPLYVPIDPQIDCPTKNCSHAVACSISPSVLFGVLLFGLENEFFISDWISINLFVFGLSVG